MRNFSGAWTPLNVSCSTKSLSWTKVWTSQKLFLFASRMNGKLSRKQFLVHLSFFIASSYFPLSNAKQKRELLAKRKVKTFAEFSCKNKNLTKTFPRVNIHQFTSCKLSRFCGNILPYFLWLLTMYNDMHNWCVKFPVFLVAETLIWNPGEKRRKLVLHV